MSNTVAPPPWLLLDPVLRAWLVEDIGRRDWTTTGLGALGQPVRRARWLAKEAGVAAGLPIARRVFQLLDDQVDFQSLVEEGERFSTQQPIAEIEGPMASLLTGERVSLNLVMRLSGIATLTHQYADTIADLPTRLVDTRKTTPGLRLLEKYATRVGGAVNHRMGLDDSVMVKDNHIAAAGGIKAAISHIRSQVPYPLTIEVETETLEQVQEALGCQADIIMLDNMSLEEMKQAVALIQQASDRILIEASGNITLDTIRAVALTGVHYVSTSAPITRSHWLDISMRIDEGP